LFDPHETGFSIEFGEVIPKSQCHCGFRMMQSTIANDAVDLSGSYFHPSHKEEKYDSKTVNINDIHDNQSKHCLVSDDDGSKHSPVIHFPGIP
jgi:hypothetical protein